MLLLRPAIIPMPTASGETASMADSDSNDLSLIRIFRPLDDREKGFLVKCRAVMPDQPGSLARFALSIAATGGNIAFFHYDRAIDSSRVVVEVQIPDRPVLDALTIALTEEFSGGEDSVSSDDVQI